MILSKLALVTIFAGLCLAQTPAGCSHIEDGYLAVKFASNSGGPFTYVGHLPGVNATGLDGHSDSLLVSRYKNGSAIAPQAFEFLECSSLSKHAYPPGYQPPDTGPTNDAFGIIRPKGDTQRCLSLRTKKDNITGTANALVDAAQCDKVPERYRSFMLEDYIYGESDYGMKLYYANADDTAVIADTPHKEVVFVTNDKNAGIKAMQLVLLTDYN